MIEFEVYSDTTCIVHGSRFTLHKINKLFFRSKTVHKTTLAGAGIHFAELGVWVTYK